MTRFAPLLALFAPATARATRKSTASRRPSALIVALVRGVRTAAWIVCSCLLVAGEGRAAPLFVPLGDLAGGAFDSAAIAVSADGSAVVGQGTSEPGSEAFRWTSEGGMVGLGDLAGGAVNSYARDVSADGSVIVGVSSAARYEAFRWTSAGGMASLGDFPGGSFSQAAGVSADGTVVAGAGDIASGSEAFRWTSAGGMIGLGDLPGDGLNSQAMGISADGSVVVGYGHIQGPFIEELGEFGILDVAWRWTAEGGLVDLGDPLGRGRSRSVARAVSADGTVVVGRWGGQAFRWTADTGMVLLGDLPGDNNAWGVSADGSVIVGSGMDGAFVWDATLGRRNLRDVLVGLDVDVTGWDLAAAHDVSHDGLTIVGVGTNPGGFREAWLAKIPEPSTAWLLGSGLGGLAALRLRSRMRSLRSPKTRPDRSPAASSRFSVAAPCNERQRRAVATELDGTKPGDPSSGPPGTGQRSG